MSNLKTYTKSILIPLIIGAVVGFIISKSIDYNFLIKPLLAPPSIVFPIAWTIIYILMGISYYLFKKFSSSENTIIPLIYYLQLFVNLAWSIIFFVFKWRFFSILWILFLVLLVCTLIYLFYKEYKISAYLNIPYLLWIIFATYLNIGIYLLNKA